MISKELENKFVEVAICIRSGQVEPRQIVEYKNLYPEFDKWYKDRYLKKTNTTTGKLYHP